MKDLRKTAAGVITVMVIACLIGFVFKNGKYQDTDITEKDSVSVREGASRNDQEAFAKGYDLPIAQSDIDKAKKETEGLLSCLKSMNYCFSRWEIRIGLLDTLMRGCFLKMSQRR